MLRSQRHPTPDGGDKAVGLSLGADDYVGTARVWVRGVLVTLTPGVHDELARRNPLLSGPTACVKARPLGWTYLFGRRREEREAEAFRRIGSVRVVEERLAIRQYTVLPGGTLPVFDGADRPEVFAQVLVEHGVGVRHRSVQRESLQDHFLRATGGPVAADGEGGRR